MIQQVKAVVENGVLRPLEPLTIPEGRQVELLVQLVLTPEECEEKWQRIAAALAEFREEADKLPAEVWEQFERDINAGRTDWSSRK